jgi:bacterioferritin-associated ferredoxin
MNPTRMNDFDVLFESRPCDCAAEAGKVEFSDIGPVDSGLGFAPESQCPGGECSTLGCGRGCDDPIVCRCFGVSENRILEVMAEGTIASVDDLKDRLCAGTGCTACTPKLHAVISTHAFRRTEIRPTELGRAEASAAGPVMSKPTTG